MNTARKYRLLFLLPGGIALLAGLDAAMLLLGVPAPVSIARLSEVHGQLMVFGFIGTLISLERAVALDRRLGYAAPVLLGLGGIAMITSAPLLVGRLITLAGGAAFVALFIPLWLRRRDASVLVEAQGTILLLCATVLFAAGVQTPLQVPFMAGFVILLIAGERMELSRLGPTGGAAEDLVMTLATAVMIAVVLSLLFPSWGYIAFGLTLIGLVGALLKVDIARRTIRSRGLPRFSAACMLAGYGWLLVAGVLLISVRDPLSGAAYDAIIHAVFLGFAMSMIMAHAPVILPAVLRRPLPYHPVMIGPAVLLHASLVLRVFVGDTDPSARIAWQVGGIGNALALLLFVAIAIGAAVHGARKDKETRARRFAARSPVQGPGAAPPGAARTAAAPPGAPRAAAVARTAAARTAAAQRAAEPPITEPPLPETLSR